jgi:hypothetical protein
VNLPQHSGGSAHISQSSGTKDRTDNKQDTTTARVINGAVSYSDRTFVRAPMSSSTSAIRQD